MVMPSLPLFPLGSALLPGAELGLQIFEPRYVSMLRDIVDQTDANVISPTDIINVTAAYFKLSVDDLYGSSRSQAIATARQIAMYLCRERTSMSLPKIGQLFGGRDHTTVMYAYKKISDLMKERRSIYNQVTEITTQLGRR